VRLEGLGQLKNAMTSSGIEPATFRLVALCINQLRYRVLLSPCNSHSIKRSILIYHPGLVHIGQLVADVPRGLSLTPTQETLKKKFISSFCIRPFCDLTDTVFYTYRPFISVENSSLSTCQRPSLYTSILIWDLRFPFSYFYRPCIAPLRS
jgi:hypothetical protein